MALRAYVAAEGSCYTTPYWRDTTVLRMLAYSHNVFVPTTSVRHFDRLERLMAARDFDSANAVFALLDQPVMDAVRIASCFENLCKARLLQHRYVIHDIDATHAKTLRARQVVGPVRIQDVKRFDDVMGNRDVGYQFQSLKLTTIGWRTLRQPAYQFAIGLPKQLFESVERSIHIRNTLHFLALEVSQYGPREFHDLRVIRDAFNKYVVEAHNRLAARLFPRTRPLNKLLATVDK